MQHEDDCYGSAIASLTLAAPTFAAPVTMTFKNVSTTTTMTVSKISTCGVLSPTPTTVIAGATSSASSTDCGGSVTSSHVKYAMGSKTCEFHISTFYHAADPITGAAAYWERSVPPPTSSGGATCKVVSSSGSITTGAVQAVFSMA